MENKVKTKSIFENTLSIQVKLRFSREGMALVNNVAGSISKYLVENDMPLIYLEINKINHKDVLSFVFKEKDFLINKQICLELVRNCMEEMLEMNVKKELSYKDIDKEFSCFKSFKKELGINTDAENDKIINTHNPKM